MTIQSEYDLKYNSAVAADKTLPVGSITVSGEHVISNTLNVVPWVKIKSDSPTYFNFKNNVDDTAIKITNNQSVEEPLVWASNIGACLDGSNGVIALEGSGIEGTMLGISIGNDIDGGMCRDVMLDCVVVSGFATGVFYNSQDTYLSKITNSRIQNCMVAVSVPYQASTNNSGERNTISDSVFGSCGEGLFIDNSGIEFNIINTSIDFCQKAALRLGANSGYQKISFTNCHLEGSNNEALIISNAINDTVHVDIRSCKIVPTNGSDPIRGGLPNGARSDGASLPRTELFKGKMKLVLDGIVVAYNYPAHDANNGFFMVDDDVDLLSARNISFTGWKQAIAPHLVVNHNWLFDSSANASGDVLDANNNIDGWSFVTSSNINAELSVDQKFKNSNKSLKFTCTGDNNWFVMESSLFDVNAGEKVLNQNAVYGGASTGKIRVQWQLIQYIEDNNGNLAILDESVSSGSDFQDLYNDTQDPSYNNGDRSMWFKEKTLTERTVLNGATKARIKITVSSMDNGDVIYLGACTANIIGR